MRLIARKLSLLFVAALTVLALAPATFAFADDSEPTFTEARGVCVTDAWGNILYGYNENEEMAPASLTKVVTAMVALDSGVDLDTPCEFVVEEYDEEAQLSGYAAGDVPTLRELLMVTLVYSGNDAATNVAYAVAGSVEAFAELMNQKVEELGLSHSHFLNPHGLEEVGHYSTAYDMCVLGRYALDHYPFIRNAVRTREITIVANGQQITLPSTDELMETFDGLIGIKTGNTYSGTSFLGAARRGHITVYGCVLCCDTKEGRWDDAASVLEWAFSIVESKQLCKKSWVLRVAPWQDGFWLKCPVTATRDITGKVLPEGGITYTSVMFKPSTLVAMNDTYGTTIWNQNKRLVESVTYNSGTGTTADTAWSPLVLPAIQDTEELVS